MFSPPIPILLIGKDARLSRVCADLVRDVSGASTELLEIPDGIAFDPSVYPLILLQLDDLDGLDRLEKVQSLRRAAPCARILAMTAKPDVAEAVRFMKMGGEDYLILPLVADVLKSTLIQALEVHSQTPDQTQRSSLSLAYIDEHTGLPNARHLAAHLDAEISRVSLVTGARFGVLFVDIDDFKSVNDRFGHRAGNQVLAGLGHFLRAQLRESDRLFRYAGDEFVIVVPSAETSGFERLAERIQMAVSSTEFEVGQIGGQVRRISLAVSIGISVFPEHAASREEILEAADRALYVSKSKGGMTRLYTVTPSRDSSQAQLN
jgi:diguanylate cyclase (GGDEF)-like protein